MKLRVHYVLGLESVQASISWLKASVWLKARDREPVLDILVGISGRH